jgi:hypothetical protein
MYKQKLMKKFQTKFGGEYSKVDGKVYWTKNGFKESVSSGFLNYCLNNNLDPSLKKKTEEIQTEGEEKKIEKKKAKKDVIKDSENPKVSEGS